MISAFPAVWHDMSAPFPSSFHIDVYKRQVAMLRQPQLKAERRGAALRQQSLAALYQQTPQTNSSRGMTAKEFS